MKMIKFLFTSIATFALSALPVCAGIYYNAVEGGTRDVKSGVPTVITRMGICDRSEVSTGQGSAFSAHGTVTFKETTAKMCGSDHWPAVMAIYTSTRGFNGVDDVTVYNGRAPFHFTIKVH